MTDRKDKEKAIGTTTAQVLGLALQTAMAMFFANKLFVYAFSGNWGPFCANAIALVVSLYYAFRLATRIAEKLEK